MFLPADVELFAPDGRTSFAPWKGGRVSRPRAGSIVADTPRWHALHFSEGRAFARLLEEANPPWLLLAVALQAATYLAQAEVFIWGFCLVDSVRMRRPRS